MNASAKIITDIKPQHKNKNFNVDDDDHTFSFTGFPPRTVTEGQEASLSSVGIGNGEVIIVEEVDQPPPPMVWYPLNTVGNDM